MDLFSIPAISSKYKREFSSANNVITNDRNRLADEMIKALEL
jgi:hAT family C-terminal dimerisation region